jgi:hypothetical protein
MVFDDVVMMSKEESENKFVVISAILHKTKLTWLVVTQNTKPGKG